MTSNSFLLLLSEIKTRLKSLSGQWRQHTVEIKQLQDKSTELNVIEANINHIVGIKLLFFRIICIILDQVGEQWK